MRSVLANFLSVLISTPVNAQFDACAGAEFSSMPSVTVGFLRSVLFASPLCGHHSRFHNARALNNSKWPKLHAVSDAMGKCGATGGLPHARGAASWR